MTGLPSQPMAAGDAGSFRLWLRDATRSDHALLDASMSALDLASTGGYAVFLRIQVAALQELRPTFRPEDQMEFAELIRCARRDLSQLREFPPAVPRGPAAPLDVDPAASQGIAYVIRGSRLGAQLLRRRVATTHPTAFLDFTTHLPWPAFVAQLDALGARGGDAFRESALRGARAAFGVFARRSRENIPK